MTSPRPKPEQPERARTRASEAARGPAARIIRDGNRLMSAPFQGSAGVGQPGAPGMKGQDPCRPPLAWLPGLSSPVEDGGFLPLHPEPQPQVPLLVPVQEEALAPAVEIEVAQDLDVLPAVGLHQIEPPLAHP